MSLNYYLHINECMEFMSLYATNQNMTYAINVLEK